jgi:hypothetical protein
MEASSKQDQLKDLIREFGNEINENHLSEEELEAKTKLMLDKIVTVVFPTKSLAIRAKEDSIVEKKFIELIENQYTKFTEVKKSIKMTQVAEVEKLEQYRVTQLKLIEGLGISSEACEEIFKKVVDSITK